MTTPIFNKKNPSLPELDDEIAALRALALEKVDSLDIWWDAILGDDDIITGVRAFRAAPRILQAATVSPITLGSAVTTSIASISLTPGWWHIEGLARYIGAPLLNYYAQGASTSSSALPALGEYTSYPLGAVPVVAPSAAIAPRLLNITSTTTYHLVVRASFSGEEELAASGWIRARFEGVDP